MAGFPHPLQILQEALKTWTQPSGQAASAGASSEQGERVPYVPARSDRDVAEEEGEEEDPVVCDRAGRAPDAHMLIAGAGGGSAWGVHCRRFNISCGFFSRDLQRKFLLTAAAWRFCARRYAPLAEGGR